MEISGKVLREVEFRDRLRGYDTDEVDEFLEKVAVGVDEMRAELVAVRQQLSQTERHVEEVPSIDDESIRRTLVLAQRTADLAINEAREEASRLLDEARSQVESLVSQAQETARRVKDEAEFEAHEHVDRLTEQRERLERDIQSLAQLLGSERDRLTQSLRSALGFVTESLSLSDDMSRAVLDLQGGPTDQPKAQVAPRSEAPSAAPAPAPAATSAPLPASESRSEPDVEMQISEDATFARRAPEAAPPRRNGEFGFGHNGADAALDPDEALWARWAQGAEVDLSPEPDVLGEPNEARRFPFPRGTGEGA